MGFLDTVKNAFRGAVAAPVVPEEPAYEVYTIRTGDTLGEIGARHGVTREALARLNDIDEPDLIFPGQEIRIPPR